MKLFCGNITIPDSIDQTQRIFQVVTFDNETVLCNLKVAKELIIAQNCKTIKHYQNFKFVNIGKKEVKEMPLN